MSMLETTKSQIKRVEQEMADERAVLVKLLKRISADVNAEATRLDTIKEAEPAVWSSGDLQCLHDVRRANEASVKLVALAEQLQILRSILMSEVPT